jgi:hypothetical protein
MSDRAKDLIEHIEIGGASTTNRLYVDYRFSLRERDLLLAALRLAEEDIVLDDASAFVTNGAEIRLRLSDQRRNKLDAYRAAKETR